jgi:hypothetical protein
MRHFPRPVPTQLRSARPSRGAAPQPSTLATPCRCSWPLAAMRCCLSTASALQMETAATISPSPCSSSPKRAHGAVFSPTHAQLSQNRPRPGLCPRTRPTRRPACAAARRHGLWPCSVSESPSCYAVPRRRRRRTIVTRPSTSRHASAPSMSAPR